MGGFIDTNLEGATGLEGVGVNVVGIVCQDGRARFPPSSCAAVPSLRARDFVPTQVDFSHANDIEGIVRE